METKKSSRASLALWAAVAAVLLQNLVIPVKCSAANFEDNKNYYTPDPNTPTTPSVPTPVPVHIPPPQGSGGGGHSTPTPFHGTPPSHSGGGSYGGTPPSHSGGGSYGGTPPSHSGGGSYGGTPPSHSGGGSYGGTPPTNCGTPPSGGHHHHNPSPPSGGYHQSPPYVIPITPVPPTPLVASPPPIITPPVIITPPTTPIDPGTPSTPGITIPTPPFPFPSPFPFPTPFPFDPNSPPFPCIYWRNHPTLIWGLFGFWGTSVGSAFGVTSLPGTGANMNVLQALSNTRSDGFGQLYREGTAALLNSIAHTRFPYTTSQVRDSFVSALSSNKAAAHQAQLFRLANEGKTKPRT